MHAIVRSSHDLVFCFFFSCFHIAKHCVNSPFIFQTRPFLEPGFEDMTSDSYDLAHLEAGIAEPVVWWHGMSEP